VERRYYRSTVWHPHWRIIRRRSELVWRDWSWKGWKNRTWILVIRERFGYGGGACMVVYWRLVTLFTWEGKKNNYMLDVLW
jgi:cell division FtsZ-interacting protein ZapD